MPEFLHVFRMTLEVPITHRNNFLSIKNSIMIKNFFIYILQPVV
jgi:hypothetical protein